MTTRSSDISGKILVGTASWSDPGFVERWYPKRMPAGDRLAWYAGHFEMVEVNSTFYSVPNSRLVERWCHTTPATFIFNIKLHKLLSRHSASRKLLPPTLQRITEIDRTGKAKLTPALERAMIEELSRAIEPLHSAGKLGAFLLQLSPEFSPKKHDLGELDHLLDALNGYRLAIELRNRHWVEGDQLAATLQFLRAHCVTLVSVDAPAEDHFTIMPPELDEITNPRLAYLRLHGRNAKAYLRGKTVAARFDYDYSEKEIAEVAQRSRKLAREATELHVVFNNNNLDYAPRAAARLLSALGQIVKRVPEQRELFGKSGSAA
jgi:uncharacterized protein YecE (DUF72 family)